MITQKELYYNFVDGIKTGKGKGQVQNEKDWKRILKNWCDENPGEKLNEKYIELQVIELDFGLSPADPDDPEIPGF